LHCVGVAGMLWAEQAFTGVEVVFCVLVVIGLPKVLHWCLLIRSGAYHPCINA
jgi:hypothetical protein